LAVGCGAVFATLGQRENTDRPVKGRESKGVKKGKETVG